MRRLLIIAWVLLTCGVYALAQAPSVQVVVVLPKGGCGAATNFLSRTSLAGSERTRYTDLICGLVSDGLIDGTLSGAAACGTYFDVLYIYATAGSTTALLNLCGTSFGGTANGSPTFTAYGGYTGTDGSTTVYIDSGFNPSSASSPKFTRNSAHVSIWNTTNAAASAAGGNDIGLLDVPTSLVNINAKYSDNNSYYRINDAGAGLSGGISRSNPQGLHIANRSGASAQQAYFNGTDQGLTPVSSGAVDNGNIYILAQNTIGTGSVGGTPRQIASASIGSSLTQTQVTNFYNRLRIYMTAVGVP